MSNHYPVMLNEVVENLSPKDGEVYVDGTFGGGGYTRAFLEKANCTVIAIDRDPRAFDTAQAMKAQYGERLIFVQGCFGNALELVEQAGYSEIDGFVLDIGVSSMQIDQAVRGFSFREDGPLDMRMNSGSDEPTAADIVNETDEKNLANLIYRYGEERASRRIAKFIVQARAERKITTTLQLADIIRRAIPRKSKDKIDPATRTFQALRIAVNDELGELERGLNAAEKLLSNNGRLVVVSFHSLEDSIVKSFLNERDGRLDQGSRHMPVNDNDVSEATFKVLKRKAIAASKNEIKENARSRSAKLRMATRVNKEGV